MKKEVVSSSNWQVSRNDISEVALKEQCREQLAYGFWCGCKVSTPSL